MGYTSPQRATLGLFTGLPDSMTRPEWLHWLHFSPTERRITLQPVANVDEKAAQLLRLPGELLAQIVDAAFWLHIRPPPETKAETPIGSMEHKDRQPVALYIDNSAKQKKRRDAVFASSRERVEAFNRLALVCKAFTAYARRAFHSQLVVNSTDGIDVLAKQYTKDAGLARAARFVRIRVGMILPGRQEHPAKRQAQIAGMLSEMEFVEHLECSRLPSPRRHPALGSASFAHLRTLDLEAPPNYYHLKPALDNMKALKRLHLFLFAWESSPEEIDLLTGVSSPPFQLDDFILLLKPESLVNSAELLHLLGSSETINKMGLQLRTDKASSYGSGSQVQLGEPLLDVVRAIMEKYLNRVVDLSLAAQFTSLMQEIAVANAPPGMAPVPATLQAAPLSTANPLNSLLYPGTPLPPL